MTSIPCPQELTGQGLRLRRHSPADLPAFTRFLCDEQATRYMAFTPEQKTPEGASAMLDWVISAYGGEGEVLSLTITRDGEDAYIGSTGAAPAEAEGEMEIYFTILPEHQGQGHATAATRLLVDHLLAQPGLTALVADTVAENTASRKVLEKLGFTLAGQVDRPAADGDLPHQAMTGLRYRLERADQTG